MRKIFHVLGGMLLLIALTRGAQAQAVSGTWTLEPGSDATTVQLGLARTAEGNSFNSSASWSVAALNGIDLVPAAKHDVHFTIARDAGRIDAEGFALRSTAGVQGVGIFTFTPAPGYASALAGLGFGGVTADRQLALAVHDVSLAFARDMKADGINGLDINKLLAFRIHGVDDAGVRALRAAGTSAADANTLVAFRIHGVTPDYVRSVRALGFAPSERELIAMRIHRVTAEYLAGLKAHGLNALTVQQAIALRIHGIS